MNITPNAKIPIRKRVFRNLMRNLPRRTPYFSFGKLFTRTLLRPASHTTPVEFCFDQQNQRILMQLDLSEFAGNDLFCLDRHFEVATLGLWTELAQNAEVVVDWGSHVGTFSLVAASTNRSARVLAIEACQKNLPYLRGNVVPYSNIEVWAIAIASTSGKHVFSEDFESGGGKLDDSILEGSQRAAGSRMERDSYEVDALSPADFCAAAGVKRIDLMKIDLEGLEWEILSGSNDFWGSHAPRNLIVEICEDERRGKPVKGLFDAMRNRGYAFKRVENLLAFHRLRRRKLGNWHFWLRDRLIPRQALSFGLGGTRLFADIQLGFVYVGRIFFRVLPFPTACLLTFLVHYNATALVTYAFARRVLKFVQPAAALGGLAFAIGGFGMGHSNHLSFLLAMPYLPLLLLAIHQLLVVRGTATVGWSVGVVSAATSLILSGGIPIAALAAVGSAWMVGVLSLRARPVL